VHASIESDDFTYREFIVNLLFLRGKTTFSQLM